MKFHNGKRALLFWYELMEPAVDFGMPSIPLTLDDFSQDEGVRDWDYPDWWYDWAQLNKTIERMNSKDKKVIVSYFKNVYNHPKGTFYHWPYRGRWNWVTKKFYSMIPDEMKGDTHV